MTVADPLYTSELYFLYNCRVAFGQDIVLDALAPALIFAFSMNTLSALAGCRFSELTFCRWRTHQYSFLIE